MLRLLAALIGILEGLLDTLAESLPGSDRPRAEMRHTIARLHQIIAGHEHAAGEPAPAPAATVEPHARPGPPGRRPARRARLRPASGPARRRAPRAATGPPTGPPVRRSPDCDASRMATPSV